MLEQAINNTTLQLDGNRYRICYDGRYFNDDFDVLKNMPERDLLHKLIQSGLINDGRRCETCFEYITTIQFAEKRLPFVRCTKSGCSRKRMPLFTNSIFDNAKIR